MESHFDNVNRLPGAYSYAFELYMEGIVNNGDDSQKVRDSTIGNVIVAGPLGDKRVDYRTEQFFDQFQMNYGSYLVKRSGVRGFTGMGPRFVPLTYDEDVPVERTMLETYYFRNPCRYALAGWDSVRMNYFDGLEQETNVDVLWSERLEDGKMAFFTLHREGTSVVETTFASNPKWAPVSVRALTNPGPPIAKERFTK